MATNLFSEIEYLKGVGKAKGEKYRKLGISTPYDLLYHIPRDYMDFRTHIPIAQTENEEHCVLKLTITKKLPPKAIRKGLVIKNRADNLNIGSKGFFWLWACVRSIFRLIGHISHPIPRIVWLVALSGIEPASEDYEPSALSN